MTSFQSTAMVRHPFERVWATTRDALPEVAAFLDDIERIEVLERVEDADGTVRLTNQWRAKVQVPAALAGVIRPDMLTWIDHAVYSPVDRVCRFRIETRFFPDRVRCTGTTRYQPAMGGRGARVSFDGELIVDTRGLPGLPSVLQATVQKGIEAFVVALVPSNLRKVVDGVARFLDAAPP
jgi:hypothetical protein